MSAQQIATDGFSVLVIVHLADEQLQKTIMDEELDLLAPRPTISRREHCSFSIEYVKHEDALFRRLKTLREDESAGATIIVSDRLARRRRKTDSIKGSQQLVPTGLVKRIRSLFCRPQSRHLCSLIAFSPKESPQLRDIDVVISGCDKFDRRGLREALGLAADSLWLKSLPSNRSVLPEADSIICRAVDSRDELMECFRLRWSVYKPMGYLDSNIAGADDQIDIDQYDESALQFVAFDYSTSRVVGTMRLIISSLNDFLENTIIGKPSVTLRACREWCDEIKVAATDPRLREKLNEPRTSEMPILQYDGFIDQWVKLAEQAEEGAELSRLVVDPEYQGAGISNMLVRMGIAVAKDMGKHFVLLECAPHHVTMYEKYGFQSMRRHHFRHQDLDLSAFGMRLALSESAVDPAVGDAEHLLDCASQLTLERTPALATSLKLHHVCLCHNIQCWKDSAFVDRGQATCPLNQLHTDSCSAIDATIN